MQEVLGGAFREGAGAVPGGLLRVFHVGVAERFAGGVGWCLQGGGGVG